jgi:hypothetical protein
MIIYLQKIKQMNLQELKKIQIDEKSGFVGMLIQNTQLNMDIFG